jgi:hypothetical protein
MHSLSLSDSNVFNSISMLGHIKNDVLYVEGELEFGWSWEIYDLPCDKASYLYIDSDKSRKIKDIICKYANVKNVFFVGIDDDKNEYPSYYIDHQSQKMTSNILALENDEDIWRFIMNDSEIRTGNDNEEGPWDTYL